MLTINHNGHFESNGKVLKSINQVLKASTDYYNDKDSTHLSLAATAVDACIFTQGTIHNTQTHELSVTREKLINCFGKDHDSILWSEAGIQELTKLALKKRNKWIKKNSL